MDILIPIMVMDILILITDIIILIPIGVDMDMVGVVGIDADIGKK
jgi:hypothetical protein